MRKRDGTILRNGRTSAIDNAKSPIKSTHKPIFRFRYIINYLFNIFFALYCFFIYTKILCYMGRSLNVSSFYFYMALSPHRMTCKNAVLYWLSSPSDYKYTSPTMSFSFNFDFWLWTCVIFAVNNLVASHYFYFISIFIVLSVKVYNLLKLCHHRNRMRKLKNMRYNEEFYDYSQSI